MPVSITATALIPPQAAYSVAPSGETCSAVGAMPRTVCENGWIGDRAHHLDALRIDHRDAVAVAVGDVQAPPRFVPAPAPSDAVRPRACESPFRFRDRSRVTAPVDAMPRLSTTTCSAGFCTGRGEEFVRLRRPPAQIAHPGDRALAVDRRGERRNAGLDLPHHFAARRHPRSPACSPTPAAPRRSAGHARPLPPTTESAPG